VSIDPSASDRMDLTGLGSDILNFGAFLRSLRFGVFGGDGGRRPADGRAEDFFGGGTFGGRSGFLKLFVFEITGFEFFVDFFVSLDFFNPFLPELLKSSDFEDCPEA